ncbi:MAG: hypothetical protein AAF696_06825 [Bacteroidota bacterium]
MKIQEPDYRFGGNWQELADLFGYTLDKHAQDWTYTIAEADKIEEYVQAYNTSIVHEDSKFSLMEMILQALNDQPTPKLLQSKWLAVKQLLDQDFELHTYTIFYWCCWDNEDLSDGWEISPQMREFWLNR